MRLKGKKAILFGGGTGLGFACAEAMQNEGAAIFLSGRREAVVKSAAEKLQHYGKAGYAAGDAAAKADVERVVDAAASFMGGVDTIVISAGTSGRTSILDADPDDYQRIVDHNMRPVFLCARFAVAHMRKAGSGSIIAISSMYGLVGQRERVAYCASKAGIIGMVRAMALDLADQGIRANAICPGFIETELAIATAALEPDPEAALRTRRAMHPIPRSGKPIEIGAAAVFLASDESAFMTGQALTMDGGYVVR